MKKIILTVAFVVLLICLAVFGQVPEVPELENMQDSLNTIPDIDTAGLAQIADEAFKGIKPDLDKLTNIFNVLIGALTIVWGVVAKALGLKERLNKKKKRFVIGVAAGGIVIAGIFVAFGLAEGLPGVVSMFTAMGGFAFLTGLIKPKKTEEEETKKPNAKP